MKKTWAGSGTSHRQMISSKHRTIFVHIPKVAGQSIETVFLEDLGLDWNNRGELLLRTKKNGEPGPHRLAHLRAKDYVAMGYTNAETYDAYFTFTFVRHPYARVLSLYHYLGYSRIISVRSFIEKVLANKIAEKHFFFISQYDYVFNDDGELLVDFVGKLENISEDIQHVFRQSGLTNTKLPHVNKSEKGLKRGLVALIKRPGLLGQLKLDRLFRNKKLKELRPSDQERIYQLYQRDFESFDYEK